MRGFLNQAKRRSQARENWEWEKRDNMTFKDLKATLNTNKKVYIEDDNFDIMYEGRLKNAPKLYDMLSVDKINVNENDITIVVIRQ